MAEVVDFSEKVILITGSTSGIGEGIATHFARLGANVVITGRSKENAKRVADICRSFSSKQSKVLEVTADLTIEDDIKNLVNSTVNEFGKIDVLVNNAGVGAFVNFGMDLDTIMNSYDAVMRTDLRAVVYLSRLAVPYLEKTKGNIINISSVAAIRPTPDRLVYNMAKSALDMFTKCIAIELGPKGIRVNSVNPGLVVSNFHPAIGYTDERLANFREGGRKRSPLGLVGQPQDIAYSVAFLASDQAKFLTGAVVVHDGGIILA